jgi:hypothetical protein
MNHGALRMRKLSILHQFVQLAAKLYVEFGPRTLGTQ